MLDRWTTVWVAPPLNRLALVLHRQGVTPTQVTVAGFIIGMLCIPLMALKFYIAALTVMLINRVLDGADGALARLTRPSDSGGFLDITLDFIFYAGVVFGFALSNPQQNALMASLLIFTFVGTGSSFLAYAIMAEKKGLTSLQFGHKSLYYMNGLAEGTETITMFVLFCLFPSHFPQLAAVFAIVCLFTTATRVWSGYQTIKKADQEML